MFDLEHNFIVTVNKRVELKTKVAVVDLDFKLYTKLKEYNKNWNGSLRKYIDYEVSKFVPTHKTS